MNLTLAEFIELFLHFPTDAFRYVKHEMSPIRILDFGTDILSNGNSLRT